MDKPKNKQDGSKSLNSTRNKCFNHRHRKERCFNNQYSEALSHGYSVRFHILQTSPLLGRKTKGI